MRTVLHLLIGGLFLVGCSAVLLCSMPLLLLAKLWDEPGQSG